MFGPAVGIQILIMIFVITGSGVPLLRTIMTNKTRQLREEHMLSTALSRELYQNGSLSGGHRIWYRRFDLIHSRISAHGVVRGADPLPVVLKGKLSLTLTELLKSRCRTDSDCPIRTTRLLS